MSGRILLLQHRVSMPSHSHVFDITCGHGLTCHTSFCGTGVDYCSGPACQLSYGPGCDGNQRPSGADTSGIPRTRVGSVPYGSGIFHCEKYGEIAITYDDGPWIYTSDLLDILAVCMLSPTN